MIIFSPADGRRCCQGVCEQTFDGPVVTASHGSRTCQAQWKFAWKTRVARHGDKSWDPSSSAPGRRPSSGCFSHLEPCCRIPGSGSCEAGCHLWSWTRPSVGKLLVSLLSDYEDSEQSHPSVRLLDNIFHVPRNLVRAVPSVAKGKLKDGGVLKLATLHEIILISVGWPFILSVMVGSLRVLVRTSVNGL